MNTMKAIRAHAPGPPDALLVEEVPIPEAGPGHVLLRVEAAAANFSDVMRRRGDVYPFPTSFPYTPGSEVAGRVEALGPDVSGFTVGDEVFAFVGSDGSTGYAQYAVAAAHSVIPVPPGLSAAEVCGLGVAGTTALLILTETARLQPGESVLVPAAAGGVGSYAVQLAKHLGAGTVIGTASTPAKRAAVLALGADHVVDSSAPGWAGQVRDLTGGRGADVVLEMTGGAAFAESLACLAPFGRLVVYGMASQHPLALGAEAVTSFFYRPSPNQSLHAFNLGLWFGMRPAAAGQALGRLASLVATGEIRPQVGEVLPLAHAVEAHRRLEARATTGKVVLDSWPATA